MMGFACIWSLLGTDVWICVKNEGYWPGYVANNFLNAVISVKLSIHLLATYPGQGCREAWSQSQAGREAGHFLDGMPLDFRAHTHTLWAIYSCQSPCLHAFGLWKDTQSPHRHTRTYTYTHKHCSSRIKISSPGDTLLVKRRVFYWALTLICNCKHLQVLKRKICEISGIPKCTCA